MSEPRSNEDRFYRYPMHRVVATLDDPTEVEPALTDLAATGVDVGGVNILTGPVGSRLLDSSGDRHGLGARLLRFFQGGAYEHDVLAAHDRALNNGGAVMYVPVKGTQEKDRVAAVLRQHGGHAIFNFRRWSVEQLPN
jgi:hypothetical protein